jgi:predicted aldo/keto reductase-like oxidoreductase
MEEDKKLVNRRKFLSSSLTSVATAGLMAASPIAVFAQGKIDKPASESAAGVIYRTLGRTGIKVPIVSMGVMNSNNPDIVRASYELGIRHFDTAARDQFGRNEQMVGDVIKRLGVRDKVIIGTKEIRPDARNNDTPAAIKAAMMEFVEGSLKRLKTDYIDILYVHGVSQPEEFNDPGIMEALEELKKQGKIRAAGVSTHESMATVIKAVTEGGFYDVVLTAFNVAMAENKELLAAISQAAAKGVGIIAMKTQTGGSRLSNPESLKKYDGPTIATASLKWVLRHEHITTAIPGYDNYQHMKEDFSVVGNIDYTDPEQGFLSDNSITLGFGFCHQCRQCMAQCPHNVDIPTLMRTHMYAAQYANFSEARMTFDGIPKSHSLAACSRCDSCRAACANTVDIGRRIEELKLIFG